MTRSLEGLVERATWSISVRRFNAKTRLMENVAEPVSGYRNGPFGVRKVAPGTWALDHIPTGYSLGRVGKRGEAVQRAEAFLAFTNGSEAWEFSDPTVLSDTVQNAWRHVVINRGALV